MKQAYECPELELIVLEKKDVIMTSPGDDNEGELV